MIAASVSLNSRIASGNQAIDGIVCRPVISEPTAARSDARRATTAAPMTRADDDGEREADRRARRSVIADARRQKCAVAELVARARWNTVTGPGQDVLGLPAATTRRAARRSSAMRDGGQLRPRRRPDARRRRGAVASVGQLERVEAGELVVDARSRRRSADLNGGMAAHLLAQRGR